MASIQDDADAIMKAAEKDMPLVMEDQKEHGMAITFYKGTEGNIWGYEDRYKKTIKRT